MEPSSSSSSPSTYPLRKTPLSPYLFALLSFIVFLTVLYSEDLSCLFGHIGFDINASDRSIANTENEGEKLPFAIGETIKGCNLFSGKWVRDNSTRPVYRESDCPFLPPQVTCQEHGRPDKEYQYWRWQPHGCSVPRFYNGWRLGEQNMMCSFQRSYSFNATLMMETLRGKRMMFVGDSLNRGQFLSMVCLLQSIIPEHAKSMHKKGSLTVFAAKDYNATIEYYWAPFLLESNADDADVHRMSDRTVRKGSINKHGRNWKGVDIMVFDTYVWWLTGLKFKILKGSFEDKVKDIEVLSTEDAYRMAMNDMLGWVEKNMDLKKTRVFFTSMSPSHNISTDWGGNPNGNCYNETTMIENPTYWGSDTRKSIMQVIGEMFGNSRVPVTFLNITQLSSYRKDAHTSIYKKQLLPLTPEKRANPAGYADCWHWCLPGVQDTWNELLFAKLFYP